MSTVCQLMRDNSRTLTASELLLLRSMLLAMGSDVRIVLIKLADRLHNLRTLSALPLLKQQRMAQQTLELFAPLANRLGIWSWKAEIEDICFACLHPQEHQALEQQAQQQGRGEQGVAEAVAALDSALRAAGVQFEDLCGRPKNLYSIFLKMQKKEKTLEQICDMRGLRLICADEASCYAALEVVHSLWRERGGRHFKDYIRNPKPNGYQSIHTVVEDEAGNCLEVQIRTAAMHQHAEFGVAAHWRYKEDDSSSGNEAAPGGAKKAWTLPAQQQAQVEWARFCLSWIAERPDTKIRVTQQSSHADGGGCTSCCTANGPTPVGHAASACSPAALTDPWGCWRTGQCQFPSHVGGCAFANFPWRRSDSEGSDEESKGSKVVIVWEEDEVGNMDPFLVQTIFLTSASPWSQLHSQSPDCR